MIITSLNNFYGGDKLLSIVLGDKQKEQTIALLKKRHVTQIDEVFNANYIESWFEDPFIIEILDKVDNIDIIIGAALHNRETGDTHAPEKLSTGCKNVILIYKFPNILFQSKMGDNCIEFVERIAAKRDVVIVSDYLSTIRFKYIQEVKYLNYGIVCKDCLEILEKVSTLFFKDNHNFEIDEYLEEDSGLTLEQVDPELYAHATGDSRW